MPEVKNMDAFEYMKSLPDASFDLIVLDPNYQDWDAFLARGILTDAMRLADYWFWSGGINAGFRVL